MSSKSDIIYRKLVLAHKLISDSDLLKCIVEVEQSRKQGKKLSLLEFILKKNMISLDDGLILRSEHDKVVKLVKEKTNSKKENTQSFEKAVNKTVDENADQILTKKSSASGRKSQRRPRSQEKSTRKKEKGKSRRSSKIQKPVNGEKTEILPKSKSNSKQKSGMRTLQVDADPDLLERNNYDPTKDPLVGKIFGGCKLISKIGEGGMGSVYKAYHIGLDKYVALKLLPPSHLDSADRVKRFKHEAKSAAKMEHPNIVQILNIGEQEGIHFIVMQYIDGEDLRQRLLRKGVFPPIEAIDICIQVAEGLSVAHKKGIVHRDIKPDNIMIEREGNIKITDFGLARQIEQGLDISKPGKALGTPYYMSPEQCSGQELDGRSDIYSLGITLYHIVTGRRPFKGKNAVSTALMHIREPVIPPEKINPNLPMSLADVILRMIEKNPKDRYQNPNELIEALKATKDSILNENELDKLVFPDSSEQASQLRNSLDSIDINSKEKLTKLQKRIFFAVGIGVISLAIAIVLLLTVFSNEPSSTENNNNNHHERTQDILKIQMRMKYEEDAMDEWKILKKKLSKLDSISFYKQIVSEVDGFVKKYNDTDAATKAEEYKTKLVNNIEKKTENALKSAIEDYDKFISEGKLVEAKERINKFNPDLLTDEIEKELTLRRDEVDKKIAYEWQKIKHQIEEYTRSEPYRYFDAIELLKNTEKINDPIFEQPLKWWTDRVNRNLQSELQAIENQKKSLLEKQVELVKKLETLLSGKLKDVTFESTDIDVTLKEVQKLITECDKYSFVLPVFKLIERDLETISFFQDIVIDKIFGNYAKRNRSTEIILVEGTTYQGDIKKSDSKGIEIKVGGQLMSFTWNQLSPKYLAEIAFNRINPSIDDIKSLAVPLFLLSKGLVSEGNEYISSKLNEKMQKELSWRLYKIPDQKNWGLFEIYYSELYGLRAMSLLLQGNRKAFARNMIESLKYNRYGGWGNITKAASLIIRGETQRAERTLEDVQLEYRNLKEYNKLQAEIKYSKREYSEARTYVSILEKSFGDDEDVLILSAKVQEALTYKRVAIETLKKAQKLYPYSEEIWQMLKDLK